MQNDSRSTLEGFTQQRFVQKSDNVHWTVVKSLWIRCRSHLMQRALWWAGWKTLVNLSSLFLTHCLTFVSTLLCLVKQRSWRDKELDKWMGQTHVCTIRLCEVSQWHSAFPAPYTNLNLKCWTLCPKHSSFNSPWVCKSKTFWLWQIVQVKHVFFSSLGSSYRIKITIDLCLYHSVIWKADG